MALAKRFTKKVEVDFPKLRRRDTYTPQATDGELGFGAPSMTEPDMAYSIPELLEKYARGLDMSIRRPTLDPGVDGDFDSPDFEEATRMDIVDRDAVYRQNMREQQEAKAKVDAMEKAGQQKKRERELEDEEIRSAHRASKSVRKDDTEKGKPAGGGGTTTT